MNNSLLPPHLTGKSFAIYLEAANNANPARTTHAFEIASTEDEITDALVHIFGSVPSTLEALTHIGEAMSNASRWERGRNDSYRFLADIAFADAAGILHVVSFTLPAPVEDVIVLKRIPSDDVGD